MKTNREFKLPPFCRAVVSMANLIGTNPPRVETIRAWVKPAHSFCRGVVRLWSDKNKLIIRGWIMQEEIHVYNSTQFNSDFGKGGLGALVWLLKAWGI